MFKSFEWSYHTDRHQYYNDFSTRNDLYATIYVPFGDTWEQGKRHIYTLIFGGGYDDQGEAVLNPIQFDAETTGWVDADKDVNVQP